MGRPPYDGTPVFDRAYGRPRQSLELDGRVHLAQPHSMAVRQLASIGQEPPAPAAPVIDAEVQDAVELGGELVGGG